MTTMQLSYINELKNTINILNNISCDVLNYYKEFPQLNLTPEFCENLEEEITNLNKKLSEIFKQI